MVTPGALHQPERPSWLCQICRSEWPCHPAREYLNREYDHVALAMYAWDRLTEAAADAPATPPRELFERFMAWTRSSFGR